MSNKKIAEMTDEERIDEIWRIIDLLPDYKARETKIKKSSETDDQYAHIINEWIPGQPDMTNLIQLFILLNFNATAFVELVIFKELKRTSEFFNKGKL